MLSPQVPQDISPSMGEDTTKGITDSISPSMGEDITTGAPGELPIQEPAGISSQEVERYFDTLPDQDKAFLAEHMTPEFVKAIGIVAGQEVAQYLTQFADPEKVLVPVPRKVAEEYMASQQNPAPQPQQPMPQQPPQSGGGMMAPTQAMATPTM